MSGVLVGFDDSAAARRALERGIAEARARSTRLVVLSVFEVPLDPQVDRFYGTLDDIADWEGQPISRTHGGPMRLIVPHLYLWKSAKWLTRIDFRASDTAGFWEKNGYHMRGDPWREERYSDD